MLSTLYITLLLGVMAFLFSRDMDNLVIRPIETMVDSVTRLAANPAHKLEAVKSVKYETDALRVSLNKIAQLLQVGFGEAGNNLVAENLKKGDTVDPMVPGKKLLGAYGFCIIEKYEEVLECLGEEILPFTNMAAKVVHEAVTYNGGQPNRNLGDAFLCVWKPQARLFATRPHSRLLRPCEHTRRVSTPSLDNTRRASTRARPPCRGLHRVEASTVSAPRDASLCSRMPHPAARATPRQPRPRQPSRHMGSARLSSAPRPRRCSTTTRAWRS
jgi:hypothetical protein